MAPTRGGAAELVSVGCEVSQPVNSDVSTTKRVTIYDVASLAGLSATTVSRMLSGRRPVSLVAHERIQAAIDELGYRPSEMARALREQKFYTVALIVRNIANEANPWAARGAGEVLKSQGYSMAILETNDDPEALAVLLRSVVDRQMDGVIAFLNLSDEEVAQLRDLRTPFVYTGSEVPGPEDREAVYSDDAEGIEQATAHVLSLVEGSIAYLGGPVGDVNALRRRRGFGEAMARSGRKVDPGLIRHADWSLAGGRSGMASLLDSGGKFVGLVAANDLIAVGAISEAKARGIRVPGDLVVTGFDNIEAAAMVSPTLTTVDPDPVRVGRAAAMLLLERLEPQGPCRAAERVVRAELICRESAPGRVEED